MKTWSVVFLVLSFSACTKNTGSIQHGYKDTFVSYQFKDKLSPLQITERIRAYLPGADTLVRPQYDVTVYRVYYKTSNYKGEPLTASGLVYVPELRRYFLPIISYQHGSAISRSEVPSMTGDLDYYMPFVLASESGAIVCETDGIGLGFSEGEQHYFEPTEAANAVVDLLRSVDRLFQATLRPLNLSRELFLTGYSQGGHATLAAQRLLETQFPFEFTIVASAPMAGIYSLEQSSQLDVLRNPTEYPVPCIYPYLIYSLQRTRQADRNFSFYFKPPYDSLTATLFSSDYPTSYINQQFPEIIHSTLQPGFLAELSAPGSAFMQAAQTYSVLNGWTPAAPTRLYHSQEDEIAFYDNSTLAYDEFRRKGGNVSLVPLNGNHLEANLEGLQRVRAWFYPQIRLEAY